MLEIRIAGSGPKLDRQRRRKRRARRRSQFHRRSSRIHGHAGQASPAVAGAGTGNVPCSVSTVPLPTLIGGNVHFLHTHQIQRDACTHDIGDRIRRAHFVKVNLLDRHAVDLGFGLPQLLEHRAGVALCPCSQRSRVDHLQNVRKMTMLARRLVQMDAKLRSGDSSAGSLLNLISRPGFKAPQCIHDVAARRTRVHQSADRHIAADSRKRVQITDLHAASSL